MALAQRLPGGGVCLSADSMQIYRGMDIGTAKSTLEERGGIPHELIDIVEPDEERFTVDDWFTQARALEARILAEGRWPIVVGGTNLYVKAFIDGLFDGPTPDPVLRAELAGLDRAALRAELERVDPEAALRIHQNDRRRTERAIEVFRLSGRPISAWQQQWNPTDAEQIAQSLSERGDQPPTHRRHQLRIIGLDYEAEEINPRINSRVRDMVARGLVEEVRRLHAAGRLGLQAREGLGYSQIIDHLEGRLSLEEAIEAIKIGSRRYAKQQRTWLRRFRVLPNALFLRAAGLPFETLVEKALAHALRGAEESPGEGGGQAAGEPVAP